jgi:hypothetical protein
MPKCTAPDYLHMRREGWRPFPRHLKTLAEVVDPVELAAGHHFRVVRYAPSMPAVMAIGLVLSGVLRFVSSTIGFVFGGVYLTRRRVTRRPGV